MEQRISYTTARDGWRLAWSVMGIGPPVLYLLTKWDLVRSMKEPRFAAAILRAAAGHTVLRFDPRGTGMSQRNIPALSQSIMCDDIKAALDAAGFERVSIVSTLNTCLWAVPFTVAHPERVSRLVLGAPMTRWELPEALKQSLMKLRDSDWLTYWETVVAIQLDSSPDEIRAAARSCAEVIDHDDYVIMNEAWYASPIDHLLPRCTVPTLVFRDPSRRIHSGEEPAMEVAGLLPNARVLSLDSNASTYDYERLTSAPVLAFLDEAIVTTNGHRANGVLSKRELEVLVLIADGKTDAQIAEALGIARATASRHVHNLLTKLGAANRAEAVALAANRDIHRSV